MINQENNTRVPVAAFVFDLGDVLFSWSASTTTSISARTLRGILKSDVWFDFDCGRISRDQCYNEAARKFSISPEEIYEAFSQARRSLQPNSKMVSMIQGLKQACGGTVKIFAMSNVSKEDCAHMEPKITEWGIFDRVFTSCHAGTRKPDRSFYQQVLRGVRMQPQEIVFIDDKVENVLAAQGLGIRAFVFSGTELVVDVIREIQADPYERGCRFLRESMLSDNLNSVTDSGVMVPDNFAKLLIQDTLPFCQLFTPSWHQKRRWNFFSGDPILAPGNTFPDDLDTTSLALTVLPPEGPEGEVATAILDDMLQYLHEDGRFQTYFDWSKPRVDEVVSANVLACFYRFGRGQQIPQTLDMIYNALLHRTYESGTRYYPHADCCLYFIARLMCSINEPPLREKLQRILKKRVEERVDRKGDAIQLAMRIITCSQLGISCRKVVNALINLQEENGGWPVGWIYRYGSTGVQLGNAGVTTAMAIKALASV